MFHNVPIYAPDKFVDLDDFVSRAHGTVIPQRDLRLVDLTTDGLHRLKISKAELIASAPINYPDTARWAEALHHQFSDVDGLVWMSRQRDGIRLRISAHRGRPFQPIVDGISDERGCCFRLIVDDVSA